MFPRRHEIKGDPARPYPPVHVLGILEGLANATPGQVPMHPLGLGVRTARHHAVHIRGDARPGKRRIGLEKRSDRPADENHAHDEVAQVDSDGGHTRTSSATM